MIRTRELIRLPTVLEIVHCPTPPSYPNMEPPNMNVICGTHYLRFVEDGQNRISIPQLEEAKPGEIELLCLAWVQRIRRMHSEGH